MHKISYCLAIGLTTVFSYGLAFPVTNSIVGLGPSAHKINPYLCFQDQKQQIKPGCALESGASLANAGTCSDNPYYAGATLRLGGCQYSDTYLGYLGLSESGVTYKPPEGVYIILNHASMNANGVITGTVDYKPINPNFNFLERAPHNASHWNFIGINLSGLEFGKVPAPSVVPNLSKEDAQSTSSDVTDTKAFINAGMNTVRVPLHWGYLQPNGAGNTPIDENYFKAYVKPLLVTLTHAKIYTIVDLHSYMRYSIFGKEYAGCGGDGACPDGTLVTDPAIYQGVWDRLYQLIKKNADIDQHYLMFDLVNEPVNVPDDKVFTIQAAVIKSLRLQGFDGFLLVEGNHWSGLHSWSFPWKSHDGTTTSNAQLFSRENFMKNGITDLSNILINVHQYLDDDFSGTHDTCQRDIRTTGDQGFNLDDFVTFLEKNQLNAIVTEFGVGKDKTTCAPTLQAFIDYLHKHAATATSNGFVGWTLWSTGHGWGHYNLRVLPNSYAMDVVKPYIQAKS